MDAFWELSTCRSFGMGPGPIPWDKIVEYGSRAGLEDDMIEAFITVVRAMDGVWVSWQNKETERENKQRQEDAARESRKRRGH